MTDKQQEPLNPSAGQPMTQEEAIAPTERKRGPLLGKGVVIITNENENQITISVEDRGVEVVMRMFGRSLSENIVTPNEALALADLIVSTLPKRAALGRSQLDLIRDAATRHERCCDLWQDSLGGMHCTECAQKTFAMLREIQELFGVGKDCKPEEPAA